MTTRAEPGSTRVSFYQNGFVVSRSPSGSSAELARYLFSENGSSPYAFRIAQNPVAWNRIVQRSTGIARKLGFTLSGTTAVGPRIRNPYGLKEPAHLVDVEINGGRGRVAGNDPHVVATDVRILDNTRVFPWKLSDVIRDLRAQYDRCIRRPAHNFERAFRRARATFEKRPPPKPRGRYFRRVGKGRTVRIDGVYVTWFEARRTLVVYFETQKRHTVFYQYKYWARGSRCRPGAPCIPGHIATGSFSRAYGVRAAYEFQVDAKNGVRSVNFCPPR